MTNSEHPWKKAVKRPMGQIALDYIKRGWQIFPAPADGSKSGCTSADKTNGNRWGSTKDPKEAQDYFVQFSNANIGIATGPDSGIFVVEADTKEGHTVDGIAALRQLEANNEPLPPTLMAESPSGSQHYYFKWPTDIEIQNSEGLVAPGIDVRGEGGMVIAPPSNRPSKGVYRWINSLEPVDAPQWLLNLAHKAAPPIVLLPSEPISDARKEAYGNAALEALKTELADTPSGKRNGAAYRIAARAGSLVGGGCLTREQAYAELTEAALSWGISLRDKALGPKGTIARALADGQSNPQYPPGEEITNGVELLLLKQTIEIVEPPTNQPLVPIPGLKEFPKKLLEVPGLVGTIARWITDTALYPQPALSLGAALIVVGTAAGRHIAGPNRCGTHLYVVALAPTGAGKNHPLTQIGIILTASNMQKHIGPSQFISMPSVINFLKREPLSICAMDEFGSFLKRTNSRRASGFEGAISGMLRTAWGSSFSAMPTPEWAQSPSVVVYSPALSIFGASTPREFYESLEGADIVNGVLNRFLIIETTKRPKERAPLLDATDVPESISKPLKAIYSRLGGAFNKLSQVFPAYDMLDISPDAEKIRRNFVDELQARGDADEEVESFLARTAENALRLATIATVGLGTDCIESDIMCWARDFSLWSSNVLAESAGLYISDSDTQAMANAVRRVIQKKANGKEKVKRSDVLQALKYKYKSRDLADVMTQMAEGGTLKVEKTQPAIGGTPIIWYSLAKGH